MKQFQDHFSGHAAEYASYRPGYPEDLFGYLASLCRHRQTAWDCATGNGQAALALGNYFDRVIGSDASARQIESATPHERVDYRVAPAESSGLEDASVDLVTVAQALHWFDIERFFAEAGRVLTHSGVLAAWSYEKCSVDDATDPVLGSIFAEVEDFWPAERRIVMNHYRDLLFPWNVIEPPGFNMTANWRVDRMLGYLQTWSASGRYEKAVGENPIARHADDLRTAWGEASREVRWPLTLKVACR